MVDGILGQGLRLARPGRQENQRRRIEPHESGQHPLAVGRQRETFSLSQANGRRAVGLAKIDRIPCASTFGLLGEGHRSPVLRQARRPRPVEPREVLRLPVGAEADHADPLAGVIDQGASVGGHVLEREHAGRPRDDALSPRARHRMERPVAPAFGRREPDLLARGGPGQSLRARPARREGRLLAVSVDERDGAGVVSELRMIEERDEVALGRDPRVTDPPRRLVEDLARRKLQPVTPSGSAHESDALAVGRPGGVDDVFEEISGGAARQGRGSQNAPVGVSGGREDVRQDQHLARARDRLDPAPRQVEQVGARVLGAGREELRLLGAIPVGGVEHGVPVGREPRGPDEAAAVGQSMEGRHRGGRRPPEEPARREDRPARSGRPPRPGRPGRGRAPQPPGPAAAASRDPTASPGRRRCRRPIGTAAPGSSPGNGERSGRDRARRSGW